MHEGVKTVVWMFMSWQIFGHCGYNTECKNVKIASVLIWSTWNCKWPGLLCDLRIAEMTFHGKAQVSRRLGMYERISPRFAQNEWVKLKNPRCPAICTYTVSFIIRPIQFALFLTRLTSTFEKLHLATISLIYLLSHFQVNSAICIFSFFFIL